MQYCIHCIYNKFQKIVFLYDNFIWHWKELSLNFGIRDYAFEPEAQNMTNSRFIVGCASICMRIWCRICGNNTWMLSANGYRNAGKYRFTTFVLPIIPSIWLLIQFHGDFTGNFWELPFPTTNILLLLMTEFTKIFMRIVNSLNIHTFAVLEVLFIFYTWYKFCCAYLTTS